jgi:hypothetical protein
MGTPCAVEQTPKQASAKKSGGKPLHSKMGRLAKSDSEMRGIANGASLVGMRLRGRLGRCQTACEIDRKRRVGYSQ